MIDEKKLIDNLFHKMPNRFDTGVKFWFRDLILRQTRIDGWIPYSERLPLDEVVPQLVCLKNGHVCIAICLGDGEFKEISSFGTRNFSKDNPVIAWQPLPAPYEVKSDE